MNGRDVQDVQEAWPSADAFTRRLLDSLFAFVGLLELDGTLLEANRAPLEAAGIQLADVRGKKFWDCHWWSYSVEVQEELRQACARAARGEVVRYDVPVRMAGDARMTIAFQVAPLRDESGRVTHLVPSAVDITDRKRAEMAFRDGEQRLALALEAGQLGFWDWHVPSGHVIFGGRWAAMLGYEPEEIEPHVRAWEKLLHPDEVERVKRVVRDHLEGRTELYECVHRLRHKDGSWRWILDRGRVVARDDAGSPVRAIGTHTDITERKLAEEALRRSEATLSAVLDALPVGVIGDIHGKIVRDNAANRELWGVPPETRGWEGYADWVGYFPDSGERIQAQEWAMARALLRGETVKNELVECERFETKERRLYLNNAAPVRDADGNIVGGVVAEFDVTDRLATERALRESEERFRALADNISQLAWMADATGAIGWYNRRWFEFTGATPEEMAGWGWMKVHHPDHVDRVAEKFRRHLQTGEPWEDTFPLRGKDGAFRWFLSRARPIRDASGKVVRWFGTNTDVTAQREAEETLRHAIQLRDEFLSVASHELRTPLTALGLQLEQLRKLVLKEANGAGARMAKKVDTAIRQADRLGTLVEGLLDVSRIASGRLVLRLERFDLREVVREVVDRLGGMAARSGSELRVAAPPEAVGTWDRSRLDQVLVNLLTNALKYGPGCPIDIALSASERSVELTVTDRGIGISDEDRERIFGRFERAVSARHYGGLGLGLYITRQIVEAHGGEIDVRSAPGAGATFVVRLPRVVRASRESAQGVEGRS